MSRYRPFAVLTLVLAGCGGVAPVSHPLFLARAVDSSAQTQSAAITVDQNNLLLTIPPATVGGCFSIAGEYVRRGNSVDVSLKQSPGTGAACEGDPRPFISRIGPLSPGGYDVRVTLDGRQIIRERVRLS
jgi:hypothetical protein